jgi:hypothetical protein
LLPWWVLVTRGRCVAEMAQLLVPNLFVPEEDIIVMG